MTAHEIRLGDGRIPGPRYAAYHQARARGGAGLQITGCTAVHHTGGLGSGGALANVDDSIVDGYRVLSGAVHEEGGVVLAQLGHSAATTHATEPGAPVWAPSAVAGELMRHGQRAHAMSAGEIAEIVAAFGAAAERSRKGGMDGVEILAAFGFLVAAFLSPVANRRTDHYGGSLENRMRFCREVVSAVRDAVGPDGIVGLRIPGDELVEGGLEIEEMKAVARAVESDGMVDYLNVIAGTNMDRLLRAEHWPPTPAQHGLFVHLAAGIRSAVELPVFTVGTHHRSGAGGTDPRRRRSRHGGHDARARRGPGADRQAAGKAGSTISDPASAPTCASATGSRAARSAASTIRRRDAS